MPEEIVERVVSEVDKEWVTFVNAADSTETFRVTVEVHLTVTGKKPHVGDTHRFRLTPKNLAGEQFHYYVQEQATKRDSGG